MQQIVFFYFEADAEASAEAFLDFLAFGADVEAIAAEADGADAIIADADALADGAAVWLAAKAETANRLAIAAAVRFFIFVILRIKILDKTTIQMNHCQ